MLPSNVCQLLPCHKKHNAQKSYKIVFPTGCLCWNYMKKKIQAVLRHEHDSIFFPQNSTFKLLPKPHRSAPVSDNIPFIIDETHAVRGFLSWHNRTFSQLNTCHHKSNIKAAVVGTSRPPQPVAIALGKQNNCTYPDNSRTRASIHSDEYPAPIRG